MERFRGVLKRRIFTIGVLNVMAIIFVVVMGRYSQTMVSSGSQEISDMIRGFQVGIFVGVQLVMIKDLLKYAKALKNQGKLKKLYIEENDERTRLINDKIGGIGYNFVLGGIAIMTVICGFYNQVVFMTLLGALIFIIMVKVSLMIYYNKKL